MVNYLFIYHYSFAFIVGYFQLGIVVEGIETLQALYTGYGDIPPFGEGPDQREIYNQGNAYIHNLFPDIDFIHVCSTQEDIDMPINENLSSRPVAVQPILSKEEKEEKGGGGAVEEDIIINELSKPSTSPTIQVINHVLEF